MIALRQCRAAPLGIVIMPEMELTPNANETAISHSGADTANGGRLGQYHILWWLLAIWKPTMVVLFAGLEVKAFSRLRSVRLFDSYQMIDDLLLPHRFHHNLHAILLELKREMPGCFLAFNFPYDLE
jgi:hypothetical protein